MPEITFSKTIANEKILQNIFVGTGNEWKSTEQESLSIWESGQEKILFNTMRNAIQTAKRMICLQSYLLQDTAIIDDLVEAVDKRNVRVFVMDAAETRLGKLIEEENDFIAKDYAQMLNKKFQFRFVHRQAENLHAKFLLIDPQSNPQGFLFTGNFTKKPFFENPELAVKLNPEQIQEFFQLFVYHFWEYCTDEQTAKTSFNKVKGVGAFATPTLKYSLVTSPNPDLSNMQKNLLKAVQSAQSSISFSTFGFDVNNAVSQAVLEKQKAGVSICIFSRTRKKAIENNLQILLDNGAEMYCHPLIHGKSLLVDNKEGFIFTANFEKHGLETGFEVGIQLNLQQTQDLIYIYNIWEKSFPLQYKAECSIQKVDAYYEKFEKNDVKPIKVYIEEIETKSNERSIKKVLDLSNFLNHFQAPKDFASKNIKLEKIVKLELMPSSIAGLEQLSENIFKFNYQKTVKKNKKENTKEIEAILLDLPSNEVNEIKMGELLKVLNRPELQKLEIYTKQ